MVDLEGRVGAVKLVRRTAPTFQLVCALAAQSCASDSFELGLLLSLRQQVLLLLLEKESAVVKALDEIGVAGLFPLRDFVGLLLLELRQVVLEALDPVLNQLDGHLRDRLFDLLERQALLVGHHLLVKALDKREVLLA